MARNPNWDKINRERRRDYVPSWRTESATPRQLTYIIDLAYQKGQPAPKLPKTKLGAGQIIDRLKELPDVNERKPVRLALVPDERPNPSKELIVEIRQRFPQLSPMTVNSMVQLFAQIDETGMCFTFDALFQEEVPDDPDALILVILRRFLEEFSAVNGDDPIVATG